MDLNSGSPTWAGRLHCLTLTAFLERQHGKESPLIQRFQQVLRTLPPLEFARGPWLAGGAIRSMFDGTPGESDFDLFFLNAEQLQACLESLLQRPGVKLLYSNELNVTLQVTPQGEPGEPTPTFKLQLIKFYFEGPEYVIDWFDYTNCQFITDGNTLMVGEYTLYDIGRKQLRIHNLHHAASTVRRMLKYARQDYTVCDETINEILKRVAEQPELINAAVRYID